MIEHAPRIAKEFHVGAGGERYALTRDLTTGEPYVVHRPSDDGPEVQLDLGAFLVLFRGRERDDLLQLIASLLPDDAIAVEAPPYGSRPARFMARWLPNRQD
ncbi:MULTISPECIES: hypothetical protein [unclassified Methylobacterium]|jgi:hypothetical protein|uniref:hypothetical protein n=1 Tax=unclassified Methylobacterium TaxID=2615210 RepID=UPI001354BE8C|nr:hypothetical protein [Methylobacterium sp. 2A]MWV23208.1 hypothetical protein [Methylobacterium sp. 2A]